MPPTPENRTRIYGRAIATQMVIAACSAVFLFQILQGMSPYRMSPFEQIFSLSRWGLAQGAWWQLVTHIFLHGSVLHFLLNMMVLASFGPWLERAAGSLHFIAIFILGGIAGGLAQIIVSPGDPLVGASGGISALMLALVALHPQAKMGLLMFFVVPVRMRAWIFGLGTIVTTIGFIIAGFLPGIRDYALPQVGHAAHLGGMLFGVVYVMVFIPEGPRRDIRDSHGEPPPWEEDELAAPSPPPFAAAYPSQTAPGVGRNFSPASLTGLRPHDPVYEALVTKVDREGLHSLTPGELRLLERGPRV